MDIAGLSGSKASVLFLSRGHGMGHATRDVVIAESLGRIAPEARIVFASYADGLQVLRDRGIAAIDLGIPALGANDVRVPALGRVLRDVQPTVAVVDEELLALPLCALFDIPAVYVTNWFVGAGEAPEIVFANNAAHVVVADLDDTLQVPDWLRCPMSFVGPICRRLERPEAEIEALRARLVLKPGRKLIAVTASGRHLANARFFRCWVDALARLAPEACGFVEAGIVAEHYDDFRTGYPPNVKLVVRAEDIALLYAASDLVVTRGGHTTLWELALAGVPAICVPYSQQVDPLHERYAHAMADRGTLVVVEEHQLEPGYLAALARDILSDDGLRLRIAARTRQLVQGSSADRAASIVGALLGERQPSCSMRSRSRSEPLVSDI